MTPPEATQVGHDSRTGATLPAVSACPLVTLSQRADFLKANRGARVVTTGFLLQARQRRDDEPAGQAIRVGFTCSKRVGNAVARNRAKRRLREIARLVLPRHGRPGWDYVLIGKPDQTAATPFDRMLDDLGAALDRAHGDRP
jgi:ribonuclease P protein component